MTDNEKTYQNKKKGIPTLSIVPDALKYYDENNERFQKIKKKIKYFEVKVRKNDDDYDEDKEQIETDHTVYYFYDNDKKLLFNSRVEYVGKYYTDQNIWIWAWALPHINKSDSSIIRNVFLYGTDMNVVTSGELDLQNLLLKNELVTSRSVMSDPIQIDIHCGLASYLAKKPMVLPFSDFIGANIDDYPLIPYTDTPIYDEDKSDKLVSHYIYYMYILDPPGV
jgi:Family of unknown function (DUF6882)